MVESAVSVLAFTLVEGWGVDALFMTGVTVTENNVSDGSGVREHEYAGAVAVQVIPVPESTVYSVISGEKYPAAGWENVTNSEVGDGDIEVMTGAMF